MLIKENIRKEVVSFILSNKDGNGINVGAIYEHFIQLLHPRNNNLIANYGTLAPQPTLDDQEFDIVNEVIWDLIVERAITPGMNLSNPNYPWLRITDEEKLTS